MMKSNQGVGLLEVFRKPGFTNSQFARRHKVSWFHLSWCPCNFLDVAGRSTSELTFSLAELNSHLYSCSDRFGLFKVRVYCIVNSNSVHTVYVWNSTVSTVLYHALSQSLQGTLIYNFSMAMKIQILKNIFVMKSATCPQGYVDKQE